LMGGGEGVIVLERSSIVIANCHMAGIAWQRVSRALL
jgi:hypothetical protein